MNAITKSLELAIPLIRRFEGFRARPYLCPAGYWTIGYGTVYKPDGSRVLKTDPPIDRYVAELWMRSGIESEYLPGILKASPGLISEPGALAAMISFAYNLGVPRYRGSTLRKKINAQDWPMARKELMKWTRAGGIVLPGLEKRRKAECLLLP